MKHIFKKFKKRLDSFFKISEHNTTIQTELFSGLTAYFTMVYLLFLVPETILHALPNAVNETTGLLMLDNYVLSMYTGKEVLTALTLASCIAAGLGSIFIGISTNLPFAQGPSLAITTFISYTVIQQFGYTYYQALALTFMSGILFLILNILGIEEKIEDAIPSNLKHAVTVGIGLFIAFIGLKKSYIIRPSNDSMALGTFGSLDNYYTQTALLTIFGIILIAILLKKHIHGAILIGKFVCIIIAVALGITNKNMSNLTYDLSLEPVYMQLDFSGLMSNSLFNSFATSLLVLVLIVISICVIEVFETAGVIIATDIYLTVNEEESIQDNHRRLERIFDVNAVTTFIGSMFGSTTVSTYVENTASIVEGGRTGLTSVIAGFLFLLTAFVAPIVYLTPSAATATTLIITGMLMMSVMKYIDFDDPVEALPAFLTMILMPMANSMMAGITVGLVSSVLIKLFTGRAKEVHGLTYVIVFVFILLFAIT